MVPNYLPKLDITLITGLFKSKVVNTVHAGVLGGGKPVMCLGDVLGDDMNGILYARARVRVYVFAFNIVILINVCRALGRVVQVVKENEGL